MTELRAFDLAALDARMDEPFHVEETDWSDKARHRVSEEDGGPMRHVVTIPEPAPLSRATNTE